MTQTMRILVVDDEPGIRTTLQEILTEEGYDVSTAGSCAEARERIAQGCDLALLDIKINDESGIDLLKSVRETTPHLPVIMITGHGSVSLASQAFKLGAHDFLEKPLRLLQVRTCIRNALEGLRLKRRLAGEKQGAFPHPVYASRVMGGLFAQAARLANVNEPVVVTGPSGSGKELLAHALHFGGSRAEAPFVATNAASMPFNLAEDELFGHEKGAFTGADRMRAGCFEQAHGGTLFLDEIGDMDLKVQAKLLRVFENGIVQRLGGSKPLKADVRIVCATHKDLPDMVQKGLFRNDLWYRISAFVLRIPGLDERREDIPLLARTFLQAIAADLRVSRRFSDEALEVLSKREYPGNVRELKHLVTRVAVFSDREVIDAQEVVRGLGSQGVASSGTTSFSGDLTLDIDVEFKAARQQFEVRYFKRALEKAKGNFTLASQAIGMAQSNFSRKIKQLGLR
jgi:two-component system, NtrC family, nitrogen regulation response regulator NtrX